MLTFNVNNNGVLKFTQEKHDGKVRVERAKSNGSACLRCEIPAGDMIMLVNLYNYIKSEDIKDEFINPYGKNERSEK